MLQEIVLRVSTIFCKFGRRGILRLLQSARHGIEPEQHSLAQPPYKCLQRIVCTDFQFRHCDRDLTQNANSCRTCLVHDSTMPVITTHFGLHNSTRQQNYVAGIELANPGIPARFLPDSPIPSEPPQPGLFYKVDVGHAGMPIASPTYFLRRRCLTQFSSLCITKTSNTVSIGIDPHPQSQL